MNSSNDRYILRSLIFKFIASDSSNNIYRNRRTRRSNYFLSLQAHSYTFRLLYIYFLGRWAFNWALSFSSSSSSDFFISHHSYVTIHFLLLPRLIVLLHLDKLFILSFFFISSFQNFPYPVHAIECNYRHSRDLQKRFAKISIQQSLIVSTD